MGAGRGFRRNILPFVDADFKGLLNDDDLKWYQDFEVEYYANAIGGENSIHRQNLSPERFEELKKETYTSTNAANRDGYGISACSSVFLRWLDDPDEHQNLVEPIRQLTKTEGPEEAFNTLLAETLDELNSSCSRDLEIVLNEYARECVKLGYGLSAQKVNRALRKKKEKA